MWFSSRSPFRAFTFIGCWFEKNVNSSPETTQVGPLSEVVESPPKLNAWPRECEKRSPNTKRLLRWNLELKTARDPTKQTSVESRSEMFKLRNVPGLTAAVGWGQKAFQWHIFNYLSIQQREKQSRVASVLNRAGWLWKRWLRSSLCDEISNRKICNDVPCRNCHASPHENNLPPASPHRVNFSLPKVSAFLLFTHSFISMLVENWEQICLLFSLLAACCCQPSAIKIN